MDCSVAVMQTIRRQARCFLTLPEPLGSLRSAAMGLTLPPGRIRKPASVPVVQWPRTSPFHGGNTGSNPVGDAIKLMNYSHLGSQKRKVSSYVSNKRVANC